MSNRRYSRYTELHGEWIPLRLAACRLGVTYSTLYKWCVRSGRHADDYEQTRGRLIRFRGQERTIKEWAKHSGLKANTINVRLAQGWSVRRTLTEVLGSSGVEAPSIELSWKGALALLALDHWPEMSIHEACLKVGIAWERFVRECYWNAREDYLRFREARSLSEKPPRLETAAKRRSRIAPTPSWRHIRRKPKDGNSQSMGVEKERREERFCEGMNQEIENHIDSWTCFSYAETEEEA